MEIGWAANKRPTDRRSHFAAGGVRKQVMFALHCNAAKGYRVNCPSCVSACTNGISVACDIRYSGIGLRGAATAIALIDCPVFAECSSALI
jgi:hypothetical protein